MTANPANPKLRIAVIGSGAAGLSAAWLLDKDRYDVTLFSKDERLGGHAHTVTVPYTLNGQPIDVYIDAGAQFFYDNYHVLFKRLLGILQAPISDWSIDFAVQNDAMNPPTNLIMTSNLRNEVRTLFDQFAGYFKHENVFEAIKSTFRTVSWDVHTAFHLMKFIGLAQQLVLSGNWGITVDEYLESLKDTSNGDPLLPADFVDNFLLPFMASIWTVGSHTRVASAYSVLTYVALGHPSAFSLFSKAEFGVWAVVDGAQGYVTKLAAAIQADGKTIQAPAEVTGLKSNTDGSWTVQTGDTDSGPFDHVIVAAPARNAVQFWPSSDPDRAKILGEYDYFETQVAIHSDTSFMPADPAEWCAVYQYWNGIDDYFQTTWQGVPGVNVFKTWVTYSKRQPDPSKVYKMVHFHHPDHHQKYFANQIRLAALQGCQNLWVAGSYTAGVDSHEYAIKSAISVVTRLDNLTGGAVSPNLDKLVDWRTQFVPVVEKSPLQDATDGA